MKLKLRQFPFFKVFIFTFFFVLFLSFPKKALADEYNKNFFFTGSEESFVFTSGGKSTGNYDTNVYYGATAGSIYVDSTGRNNADTSNWTWSGTWEDLGIPQNSVVTGIGVSGGYTYTYNWNTVDSVTIGPIKLQDSSSVDQATLWSGRSPVSADGDWQSIGTQSSQSVPSALQDSTSSIKIYMQTYIDIGNNASARATINFDQLTFTITYTPPADPPSKIVFTNSQRTLTAGACNGDANVLTVQLQDGSDNPAYPYSDVTVAVSSNSPDYVIYSDNTCSTTAPSGQFTFTTSDHTKSVYIKDYRRSNPTWILEATGTGLTTGTQSITINAGAVTRLVVTLPSQSFNEGVGNTGSVDNQTAGSSFSITKLTATDNYFNINTGYSGAKTIAYSGPSNSPSGQSPSYTTSVSFTNGQSTTTLTTTLYKAETTSITATDGGSYGYVSSNITVNPGAINNYEVTVASPQTAGVCFTGTNTIKARDAWNNYRTADTSIVNMTSTGTGVTFFSNAGCSGSTTQYTLSSGEVTIYLSTTKKQNFTVTATRDGSVETGTSDSITVNAAAVSRLVVTLPGQTFTDGVGNSGSPSDRTAGSSFNITSISATDDYFNVNTGYSGAKTLAYTGPSNAPDTTAPSYTTSVSFTNGQSTTTLATTLYKAEAVTITVTDGGQYGHASSSVTVNPGEVSADSNDSTVTGNASSYVDTNVTITVTLKDTWKNPKSGVAAAYITLSATATNNITQPSSATDANGQTTETINWSDTGEKTVSVAISTISLVQNDGSTPDADGYLDDTHVITAETRPASTTIKGGTKIRGGTSL
jgi:hypothetical protein